ncbi:uncharacterized protein LOC135390482 [Ornithodoros turicata]|uniref:uncharacterized protein LOC135390482 n=1 Tax=Ornithodoros turicata TaxID=34597 RepID=UPI003138C7EE
MKFGDDTVDIAHRNWENDGMCAWPPVKDARRIRELVISGTMPGPGWKWFPCVAVGWFRTYEDARKMLPRAEDTSDLASEIELGRGKRKRRRRRISSDSDVESSRQVSDMSDVESVAHAPTPRLPTPPLVIPDRGDLRRTTSQRSNKEGPRRRAAEALETRPSSATYSLGLSQSGSSSPASDRLAGSTLSSSWDPSVSIPRRSRPLNAETSAPADVQPSRGSSSRNYSEGSLGGTQTVHAMSQRLDQQPPQPRQLLSRQRSMSSVEDSKYARDFEQIIRLLHTIRLNQEEHGEQLHLIMSEMTTRVHEELDDDFLQRPFEDLDEFLFFDNELKTSADRREKLRAFFCKFGGRHAKEKTVVALQHLMGDTVAEQFSWYGKKGKMKFYELNSCDILLKALCRARTRSKASGTAADTTPTYKEVEAAVKDWLRRAKERRASRSKAQASQEEELIPDPE